jgi:tetratricopeptide (TPR) repeat protein
VSAAFLSAEEYDERAHRCYDEGEYDEALELLREGLCRYPHAADLHVGLGYVRLAREEFAWARHSFETALTLEADHEDAWVGLGEALLKFGEKQEALCCFARVDQREAEHDLDLGLAIARALYREGMFDASRCRLLRLAEEHPESAEVPAALGYALHALGDDTAAVQQLKRALVREPGFHEARIYLSHILYERGDYGGALAELERVPPEEHWDTLSLWRAIELKRAFQGYSEDDVRLGPWRERLAEMEAEPDAIDHLLAEVEAAFDEAEVAGSPPVSVSADRGAHGELGERGERRAALPRLARDGLAAIREVRHRVRTREGDIFVGTWEQIVQCMRDRTSDRSIPISLFMFRAAARIRQLTGCELPHDDAEAFVRASASLGLLEIED